MDVDARPEHGAGPEALEAAGGADGVGFKL